MVHRLTCALLLSVRAAAQTLDVAWGLTQEGPQSGVATGTTSTVGWSPGGTTALPQQDAVDDGTGGAYVIGRVAAGSTVCLSNSSWDSECYSSSAQSLVLAHVSSSGAFQWGLRLGGMEPRALAATSTGVWVLAQFALPHLEGSFCLSLISGMPCMTTPAQWATNFPNGGCDPMCGGDSQGVSGNNMLVHVQSDTSTGTVTRALAFGGPGGILSEAYAAMSGGSLFICGTVPASMTFHAGSYSVTSGPAGSLVLLKESGGTTGTSNSYENFEFLIPLATGTTTLPSFRGIAPFSSGGVCACARGFNPHHLETACARD